MIQFHVRLHIEEVPHESIRDLVCFLVREFPVCPVEDWHGDVALPYVGEIRIALHGAAKVTISSRRLPVSEVSQPYTKTNQALLNDSHHAHRLR